MHLVMFDIDGTLVDSDALDAALYAQAVTSVVGVEVDPTFESYHNITDSGILEEILAQSAPENARASLRAGVERAFTKLVRAHADRDPAVLAEIPGARGIVEHLRTLPEVRVAIATGGWAGTAELKLRAIGLDPSTLALATASDAVERTAIMRLAARRAGASAASRATYFGDGEWDRRASTELGYEFVAVGRRVSHERRIDDFTDAAAVLEIMAIPARERRHG